MLNAQRFSAKVTSWLRQRKRWRGARTQDLWAWREAHLKPLLPQNIAVPLSSHENSRTPVPLVHRHHSCKCVHVGLIHGDAESKGSHQPPCMLLQLSSLSEKVDRGMNSLHVVLFPTVQVSRTAMWEGKRAFQWGGGNRQWEPRQLSGTHLCPAPSPPPECQCCESGSLAL